MELGFFGNFKLVRYFSLEIVFVGLIRVEEYNVAIFQRERSAPGILYTAIEAFHRPLIHQWGVDVLQVRLTKVAIFNTFDVEVQDDISIF